MQNRALSIILASLLTVLSFPAMSKADSYGAIALSPGSGATGWSYDYPTRRGAERRAMEGCNRNAYDCRVAIWFRNACGAVATGNGGGWGSGWGDDRYIAEYEAMQSCNRNAYGCRVIRWQCSGAR